jgi:WbqC-like protein family
VKIAVMQPYLFPYIGYFQLINAADKFVVHDDVQWIKGGWINRNRILSNGRDEMLTLSIKKRSNYDNINLYEVLHEQNNQKKFLNKIVSSYAKSPHFNDVFPMLEKMIMNGETNLTGYIMSSLEQINAYLNIDTKILLSSETEKNNELKGQDRVIDICKALKATQYINPIGGVELYDKEAFRRNNIELSFLKTGEIRYKQFDNDFIPFLSIIDVLMFNSIDEVREMLKRYELV